MASSNVGGPGGGNGGPSRPERPNRPERGPERPVSYQPEERYWTDYLRIALPVLGLLLLIGLLWYWASALIGNGTAEPPLTPSAVAAITPINQATPPPLPSPTPVAVVPTQPPPTPVPTQAPPVVATVPAAAPASPTAEVASTTDNPCSNLPVYEVGTIVETTEQVNLREGPSTDANPIQVLPQGTRLQVTGQYSESGQCDWWPVTTVDTGQSGFVIEQYLKLAQQ